MERISMFRLRDIDPFLFWTFVVLIVMLALNAAFAAQPPDPAKIDPGIEAPKPDIAPPSLDAGCNVPIDLEALRKIPAIMVGGLFMMTKVGPVPIAVSALPAPPGFTTVITLMGGRNGFPVGIFQIGVEGGKKVQRGWRNDALLDERHAPRPEPESACRWVPLP